MVSPSWPRQVDACHRDGRNATTSSWTAADGVFPVVALAEGKGRAGARATVHRKRAARPIHNFSRPSSPNGVGTIDLFTATRRHVGARPRYRDLNLAVVLGGNMVQYDWTINGEPYSRTIHYTLNR